MKSICLINEINIINNNKLIKRITSPFLQILTVIHPTFFGLNSILETEMFFYMLEEVSEDIKIEDIF